MQKYNILSIAFLSLALFGIVFVSDPAGESLNGLYNLLTRDNNAPFASAEPLPIAQNSVELPPPSASVSAIVPETEFNKKREPTRWEKLDPFYQMLIISALALLIVAIGAYTFYRRNTRQTTSI